MSYRKSGGLRGALASGLIAGGLLASCTTGETLSGSDPVELRVCPEAIRISKRGNPVGLSSGHIRHCWPGEAYCFCDSDQDCYAEEGYVPCVPPNGDAGASADAAPDDGGTDVSAPDVSAPDVSAPDASVVDASVVDASVPDVIVIDASFVDAGVVDAGGNVCPEAVRISAAGNVVGVVSGHIRQCWPGEARCFCDRDEDCYAESGYVPCTPPGVDAGVVDSAVVDRVVVDSTVVDSAVVDSAVVDSAVVDSAVVDSAVVDSAVLDGSIPAADPVVDSGAFSGATGYYTARLTVMGEGRDVWVYAPASRGANPALVVAFHGTNGDGDVMITGAGLRSLADAQGIVVVAPTARWFGGEGPDYDHPGGNGTYWETRSANVNTNADLVLTRSVIVEAQRRYGVDPSRVYVMGHSNGGFMSLLVSVALRDRVAAFAENSAGMVTCASRPSCYFQASSNSCAAMASESGWCGCSGPGLPVALPTTGRQVPGYLSHYAQDPIVSVFYTCALSSRMSALGIPNETVIRPGGHDLSTGFAQAAWAFLSRHRLP